MKKNTLVVPVGENEDTVFSIIRTFPVEKVILISDSSNLKETKKLEKDLKRFRVDTEIFKLKDYSVTEIFRSISLINSYEKDKEVLINVSSGSKVTSCLSLCAAYVNGVKAVGVVGNDVMLLPIMKFSYYKILSDPKLKILKTLSDQKDCCSSFEELSKKTKMSLPLISYHINGVPKTEGLKNMGLVKTTGTGKKINLKLTELAELLMTGYL